MVASLSGYDLWRTTCPEHEDAEDYSAIVKRFCEAHEDEIDQLLEMCSDLNRAGENEGLDRNEFPLGQVVDFIDWAYPGFKPTDRLSTIRKRGVR